MTPDTNRSFRLVLAAAGTGLGLLLAGCDNPSLLFVGASTEVSVETVSPAAPSDAAVRWVDGFCGAVHGFRMDTTALAQSPNSSDPKASQRMISKLLGDYAANLTKAIDRLTALPPAPDPVGKAAYETFLGKYTSARDRLSAAKAELDKAAPTNYAAQNRATHAFETAQDQAFSVVDPVGPILSSPTLRTAAAIAPRCSPAG
jgi:hypothetical protein